MYLRDGLRIGAQQHLFIGDCDTVQLAEEFGTPLYVMDERYLRNMCRTFVRAMKKYAPSGRVSYASKAFTNRAMCRIMEQEEMGIDVVSGGELYTAMEAGFPMERVTLHGNVKTYQEMALAVQSGVGRIVLDSRDEIGVLQRIAASEKKTVRVLIRLNPGIEAHTHQSIQTARVDCKFGLGIDDGEALQAVKDVMASPNLRLMGVHTHIGSQIFELAPYYQALDKLTDFMVLCTVVTGCEMCELNLGGGFGVRYTEKDDPIAPEIVIRHMAESLQSFCARKGMHMPILMIEPGRAIVAEAGISLYTIEAIK
ncbi:MAG: diaminopimelate decarboxylase, partial [Clostridia bacterium]